METHAQENAVLSQNQPILPEQSKQNNFLVILLSALLLLSVSIAGFFAYQTQTLVKELTLLKSSPTPVSSTEPALDPTADWKTYNDEKNRFSFSYPEEVAVKKENGRISLYLKGFDYPLSLIPEAPHNWGEGLAKDQLDKIYTKSFQYPDNPSRNMYSDSSVLFVIEFRTANNKDQSKEYLSIFDQILSTFKFID